MKTAEEYLEEKFPNASHLDWFKPIKEIINAAQIDAIKACADLAKVKDVIHNKPQSIYIVDKQSILNLIKKVK